ncbi:MAG: UDP-N-acetylglucosamine 2-epimerase (hydrolyzing) [Polaromonas sp.]|uniref:UDP-N-acetylglucosamine 2-epimerase n=1 Tax=Polaromonas sp. TaxID=1869339 RepID=UPI0025D5CD6A|nr:UDP-N-acetylglucosamine 2-epimerase [Polaromonas sp.]MBI2725901.1 UDP-N-acetylglucosamine 2-epimerase (hydrolyzing) [Polaromonas sp.]
MTKRKICVVITTRGNYAKMKSVISAIQASPDLELQLILGGMVVLEKYGRILNTIADQNLPVSRTIHFVVEGENLVTMAKSAGLAVAEFATAFEDLKPDVVLVIADRFECLPIAMAAAYMNIVVAHVEGGEVSGSIDESIRHSITKLAHLHFPSSKEAAARIARMGENPAVIFPVGGTSMDVIRQLDLADLDPVRRYMHDYGMGSLINLDPGKYLLLTQHPVTTEYDANLEHIRETIAALQELNMPTVWVMPNMDAGSDGINKGIRMFRESDKPDNIHFFKSLPIELFAPLMKNAACLLGNSSSGIRESAFLGTPSVNIGSRQFGRQRGENVTDVSYDRHEIVKAVRDQLAHGRYASDDIYGDGYAADRIVDVLKSVEFQIQKTVTY